jgi:GDP-mannose 6-dehydrogenase
LSKYKGKTLGFIGLSFKGGTDDLRESPIIEVIETLIGKGFKVKIYDQVVSLSHLIGANKEYIEREIPHISLHMLQSLESLVECSDILTICNRIDDCDSLCKMVRNDQLLIDLARSVQNNNELKCQYYGICW